MSPSPDRTIVCSRRARTASGPRRLHCFCPGSGAAFPRRMHLGVGDAARLFDVSEEQVYAWIREGSIPFSEVNEQYRFHRAELLEWATSAGHRVSVDIFHGAGGPGG